MENKEDKVCPLKIPQDMYPYKFSMCLKDKCAWWIKATKECAIHAIGNEA